MIRFALASPRKTCYGYSMHAVTQRFRAHTSAAIARHRARLQPRRLNIVVEVDPALAEGMSPRRVEALARGVTIERVADGVTISRLPRLGHDALIFASMPEAVEQLHALADMQKRFANAAGGMDTATGRYRLDCVAFIREIARELVQRHRELWPNAAHGVA